MPADSAADDLSDAAVLRFPDGIPGFPACRRFRLDDLVEDSVFQILTCLEDPAVSMIVAEPWTFFPDYEPELDEAERAELDLTKPDDAVVFCPVTLGETETVYVNLLGPFVVNARTRIGRQVVLADGSQPVRAEVALGVAS